MLEVEGLCFKYTDKQILNNVTFRLFNHDHAVIVGPNGVGKSTFLNLICKNLLPDSGTIEWLPNIKYAYLDQHIKINSNNCLCFFTTTSKIIPQTINLTMVFNKDNSGLYSVLEMEKHIFI